MKGDIGVKDAKIARMELLLAQMKDSTDKSPMPAILDLTHDHSDTDNGPFDVEEESS